ncbi:MAG TPA: VWA domain-containing protein [Pyrinomonadaceae bacterium]|jgi:VWFA-related protein|nr:VWA domain-containing protein [Pyrinomonadaceae bacterium]
MHLSIFKRTYRMLLCLFIICLAAHKQPADAQTSPPTASTQNEDVIRVNAELVQTDVMVFDKQGRFVDNIPREQFELKVDGKPVAISFLERVVAGSNREEALALAARGGAAPSKETNTGATERGRTIIFFLDDLHLSAESIERTRRMALDFIEREMSPADQVLIASASGQIGFLSQFTDNRAVLRAALARVHYKPNVVRDTEHIGMTEYTALRIDQNDRDAIDHYVTEMIKASNFQVLGGLGPPKGGPYGGRTASGQTAGVSREMAERNVKERAQTILKQASSVTSGTLYALESLMRSSQDLSGRKLVFFISDGFYLNDRNTAFSDKLKQITDAATRAGVVIYSIDARGLVSLTDASSNRSDPNGRLSRSNTGEVAASQDALNALAGDTGGRAHFNSGALTPAVNDALRETSNYYRLAWRPEPEAQKGGKFKRIEISISGRPELSVRLPRGYLDAVAKSSEDTAKSQPKPDAKSPAADALKPAERDLRAALTAGIPKRALPLIVSATFLDTPTNGPVLTASTQVATGVLDYGADNKRAADVDVIGAVLNADGKQSATFKTHLNVNPLNANAAAASDASGVIYNYRAPLAPGLYQVRVAARDERSGRTGSAMQWIEIPDLKTQKLSLSSLLVGVQLTNAGATQQKTAAGGAAEQPQVQFSVDHRFPRASRLGFWVFIYNASKGANSAPDLAAQVQVFRNSQAVVNTPFRPLAIDATVDPARIPYIGSFPLQTLSPGRYLLQITVNDRLNKTTATERAHFVVE